MTDNKDIRTLLSSLLRAPRMDEEEKKRKERAEGRTDVTMEGDNPLSHTELYMDDTGNRLPSRLHVIPLYGRPVLPTQLSTVHIGQEWLGVATEIIASSHHMFALFALTEEAYKKGRRAGFKHYPKTGTMVRLLSAKTGPDSVELLCEGVRRVSLLGVADQSKSLAEVHYPEIEYALANPTIRDKIRFNANELRQSLKRSGEAGRKMVQLRRKIEDYAASLGLYMVQAEGQRHPEFYLIRDEFRIGRVSLAKLDALIDFLRLPEIGDEERERLAVYLAQPSDEEIATLHGYFRELDDLIYENKRSLRQDLRRISPKTLELAENILEGVEAGAAGAAGAADSGSSGEVSGDAAGFAEATSEAAATRGEISEVSEDGRAEAADPVRDEYMRAYDESAEEPEEELRIRELSREPTDDSVDEMRDSLSDGMLGEFFSKLSDLAQSSTDNVASGGDAAGSGEHKSDLFDLFTMLHKVGDDESEKRKEFEQERRSRSVDSVLKSLPEGEVLDDGTAEETGPNFGFVGDDTSIVTFLPGDEDSEDLLLKLTELRREQEARLKASDAARRAKNAATGSDGSETEPEAESKEFTRKELASELNGLFELLGNPDAHAEGGKWSSLQRTALIRTKLAELLGGKVVFGAGSVKKGNKGAQRDVELRAYCLGITAALQELLTINPLVTDEIRQYLSRFDMTDPSTLADCSASITRAANEELQSVLDTIAILPRLRLSFDLVSRELSAAKLQDQIKSSVAEKIQKRQKEFFLREQLNEIKSELGLSADEKDVDAEKFKGRMAKLNPPEHIKKRFEEEMQKLSLFESSSPEYAVTRNYLDILTTVPWGRTAKEKFSLDRARKILDQDHEGLQDVKDRIIEFMAVGALKGETKGQIMLFAGPPGVGKTSIGKSIAKALGRPFYRLSLGGIDDVSEIKGHRKTYVGAMPGKILSALRETQVMNPVIMLDEIDKLGRSYKGDPDSALLETLDPEQNKNFLDVYLDEKLDLSNCLFICTANGTDTISPPLLDRMDPIRLSGYIAKEKFEIAKKHLIPRALKDAGIKGRRTLQIPDATLSEIIEGYARESGVRSLERAIAKLIRKAAVKLVEGDKQVVIRSSDLEDYLGTAPFKREKMLQGVGIMTGLAWTASGGVTLPVESIVTGTDAAGFKLTGSLGDVMKESAGIAMSFVQSHLNRYADKRTAGFFKKRSVHLHVPEGAIPKDGPSAGITMATSLLSLALDTEPAKGYAMTGELTLTGHVLPIGGLREKVIAARRMGIFDLIIPIGNEGDVKELPEQVRQGVTFTYADTFDDVAYMLFDKVRAHLVKTAKKQAPQTVSFKSEEDAEEKARESDAKTLSAKSAAAKRPRKKTAAQAGRTEIKKRS